MNRREAIKRTAISLGGLALVPGALGVMSGCTPGSQGGVGNSASIVGGVAKGSSFLNVKELKGIRGEYGETALLSGYYEANDGGGTEVYWDEDCDDVDDSGMVFQVDGVSKGRWRRPETGYINVQWFGARGDGVFRPGKDNDVHVFDRCLEWIRNHETKRLYVPAGVYILEHGMRTLLNSDFNGLEFYGDGEASELRFPDNAKDIPDITQRLWMIRYENNQTTGQPMENMYFHDLKLNGNRQKHGISHTVATGYGIWIGGSNLTKGEESRNIKIERVHTVNHTTSGFSLRTSNMEVTDCYSEGHILHGFETRDNPKNIIVEGYKAHRCGDGRGYGFDFSSGDNLVMNNFEIDKCHSGMKVSVGIQKATMTNGTITNSTYRAIDQSGVPHPDFTFHIDNVTSENNGGPSRFNIAKKITIGSFVSRNDGGGTEAMWIDNNIENFQADNIKIVNASGLAMRLYAESATIETLNINGASGEGVQSRSGGNKVTINGGKLENINGACIIARGNSVFNLSNMQFIGSTAIEADSGSTVTVTGCDFTQAVTNYTGRGTVTYKGTNKI